MSYWIEELPSGRHRGVVRTPSGKKVSATKDYRYEAEEWCVAAEKRAREAANGTGSVPTDQVPLQRLAGPTIGVHGQVWVERRRGSLSAATVKWYSACVRNIAATDLGQMPIDAPRRSHVEQWITAQVDAKVGSPSINAQLKVLRMIFQDGLAEGLCDRDPTQGVKYLPTNIRAERVLSKKEEAELLAQADPALTGMILLAIDAGLRWEEAAAIGTDCFLGKFLVVRQVIERDTRTLRAYPKGHRARNVPMTKRLKVALAPLITAAKTRGTDALLFVQGQQDRPLDYWDWRRKDWRPACYRAHLTPRPRFHDLRHTYGSRLAADGVPRSEIAELLGHADEETTARYIHTGTDGHRLKLVRKALA